MGVTFDVVVVGKTGKVVETGEVDSASIERREKSFSLRKIDKAIPVERVS